MTFISSSSSPREWFNMESKLPALADNREIESSGDFDLTETLKSVKHIDIYPQ
jgi:hypothetical protein